MLRLASLLIRTNELKSSRITVPLTVRRGKMLVFERDIGSKYFRLVLDSLPHFLFPFPISLFPSSPLFFRAKSLTEFRRAPAQIQPIGKKLWCLQPDC